MTTAAWRVERFDEIDSTNTRARAFAEAGYPDRTMVVARSQTAGRGRQGRPWQSIPGNLLCTALWRPDPAWPSTATFPLAVALAAKFAIDRLATRQVARIKWPNDILINGRKICGILIETGSHPSHGRWLIAGLGINIVAHPPDDSGVKATSLQAEEIFGPDATAACDCLIESFEEILPIWAEGGFGAIRERYVAGLHGLGERIRVRASTDGPADREGLFVDIAADGRLILEADDGVHLISAGDVFGLDT